MSEAFINSNILTWALERSNLPVDHIAHSIQIKPEKLDEWQNGITYPTFRQAQKLAKTLRVPFGYLFLTSVPEESIPIPDLRTLRNAPLGEFSPDFIDLINNVILKQQWYRDYLLDEGTEPLAFLGKFSIADDPGVIARNISQTLGINDALRESCSSWEGFLRKCISLTEAQGIIVFRSGVVGNNAHRPLSVDEFRGFAISDNIAPVVFINSRDYKVAQIFTFAHELAHIWIGESGISNITLNQARTDQKLEVEYFCNDIAAELLVPHKQFLQFWNPQFSFNDNVKYAVRKFRVSTIVVIRRAFDVGIINEGEFKAKYSQEIENQIDRRDKEKEDESGGGDYYRNLFTRNSKTLTATLISATLEGELSYRDASNLLNVSATKLKEIAQRLAIT